MKTVSNPTKERILSAAELLFAETGIATTSLRRITGRARVNLAAVNYHFGSKDGLIDAVYERRLGPVTDEWLANIEALENKYGEEAAPVELIVEAFVLPVARLASDEVRGGRIFMRLLAQGYSEARQYFEKLFSSQYQHVLDRYRQALRKGLPHVPGETLCWRLQFLLGAMTQGLSGGELLKLIEGQADPRDTERAVRELIPFLVAGLRAEAPENPEQRQYDLGDARKVLRSEEPA
ncbi:TetR/AcrR family transcriptional regulator [Natronospira bacteriovora]|uniref:TetR/AcrR family transcriptional regulator n=1 Tax=Natronospira bacteriovora TaxID=3069753 RepID=A0ABU0W682_9GAMM|nr:TetR/AcrR family transcriptional regulator [Natronospira sp. AB-CW4]MDQ2069268.1 TetR/AcrR family transcriptional regulator [Natronospira sp. AB-CW4]